MSSYYLPEKRALFLHIPRTGGTWIKQAMHLAGIPMDKWGRVCEFYRPRKHTILPHVRPELLCKVDYVFAFVRRPCEYYVSVWRFTARAVQMHPERMQLALDGKDPAAINEAVNRWKPNFDEWLDEMLEEEPGWVTRWFERFVGPPGGEFCHFVGRTETLEGDLESVLTTLGYRDELIAAEDEIKKIKQAYNTVRACRVPHLALTDEQRRRIERSERVHLRRFYGEDAEKRVYRNFEGEPT